MVRGRGEGGSLMQQLRHARPELLKASEARNATDEEKIAVDNFTATVEDVLGSDGRLIIYGLSQSLSSART